MVEPNNRYEGANLVTGASACMPTRLPIPAPMVVLRPGPEIDGSRGINRSASGAKVMGSPKNDYEAIMEWLGNFKKEENSPSTYQGNSPHTYRSYRREAERLYVWATCQQGKPISSLVRNDIAAYEEFLSNPQPRDVWCRNKKEETKGKNGSSWYLFSENRGLSPNSRRQALIICNAMLAYWVKGGYIEFNPITMIRQRNKKLKNKGDRQVVRFIEQDLWLFVLSYIDNMPAEAQTDLNRRERLRYLLSLLYLLAARSEEIADSKMESIHQFRGQWWWSIAGKGRDEDDKDMVPVADDLLIAIKRYRNHMGLTPEMPQSGDKTALFPRVNGGEGVSANMVYRLVKAVFRDAAKELNKTDPDKAKRLERASPHWIRHSALTHMADAGVDIRVLQAYARHAKIETTMIYLHQQQDALHKAIRGQPLKPPNLASEGL